MPPVYLADYADELKKMGRESFLRAYPHPVLIVKALAGKIDDSGSYQGTRTALVTGENDTLHVTRLMGRVFVVAKGKFSPPGPVLVGRTSDNDVAIPDYSVSKVHCWIATVGKEIRLTDRGSTNGTTVNGKRLISGRPVVLVGGESVTIGRFSLMFHVPAGFASALMP
jgi:pSer/pThr/pTyr-binding forkhead associated (FHA) protein